MFVSNYTNSLSYFLWYYFHVHSGDLKNNYGILERNLRGLQFSRTEYEWYLRELQDGSPKACVSLLKRLLLFTMREVEMQMTLRNVNDHSKDKRVVLAAMDVLR